MSHILLILLSHNFVTFSIKRNFQIVASSNNQKIGQILEPYNIEIQKNPKWRLETLVHYVLFCYSQKGFLSRQKPVPKIVSRLITHQVLVNLYLIMFCDIQALFHHKVKSEDQNKNFHQDKTKHI